jgi:hypothetical protein
MAAMGESGETRGNAWLLEALGEAEKRFWRELWSLACEDALAEMRIDLAKFGPVQATVTAEEPRSHALNFVLGAAAPGAVAHGHLEDALAWLESHEVEYRVQVETGAAEAAMAENALSQREHRRLGSLAKLVRDASTPRFAAPAEIDLYERVEPFEDEAFGDPFAESLGLPYWGATFFDSLPGRDGWHCCCGASGDEALAYAVMMLDRDVAVLALASNACPPEQEGKGQAAVLHSCIVTAEAAGCKALVVADAGQEPAEADRRSLVEAGFEPAYECAIWRPKARVTM